MNNLEENLTHKVIKDNYWIQKTQNDLTKNEQKIVNYLISMIHHTDDDSKLYVISISDFANLLKIDKAHLNKEFNRIINEIGKKSIWNPDKPNKKHWIVKLAQYDDSYIGLQINPILKNHIINLHKNFTQYDLYNIVRLQYKYSVRLYELFKSYSYKGVVVLGVNELAECLVPNSDSYKVYSYLRNRLLDKSLSEINAYTDLDITYEPLNKDKQLTTASQGHRVEYIRFYLRTKEESRINAVLNETRNSFKITQTTKPSSLSSRKKTRKTSKLVSQTTNVSPIPSSVKTNTLPIPKKRSIFSCVLDIFKRLW